MPDRPVLRVQVAFVTAESLGTVLQLDDPTRGRLDAGRTLADGDVWVDLSSRVEGLRLQRGTTRLDGPVPRYETGTCTITLDNADRALDPTNLDGPYVTGGATQVTPMRGVRVQALWDGVLYDLWRGYADSWLPTSGQGDTAQVVLTCSDAFKVLSGVRRAEAPPVGAGEDSGARVDRILDSIAWPAADRMIATGNSTVQATTLQGSALEELQLVAETELGELYVDAGGRVVFRNREAVLEDPRSASSQGTFGDADGELCYAQAPMEYDDATLRNQARITREGGTEQVADDAASQAAYLTRTYERSGLVMETDGVAAGYAQWVVAQGAEPELRFRELVIDPHEDDLLWPQVLGRDLGDRITVRRTPPGGGDRIERGALIRGVLIEVTGDEVWQVTWPLQATRSYPFFVLDDPERGLLDAGNVLTY